MRTTIISDSDPVNRAFAVTPSDSTDLAVKGCKIYLSASGDLKVTLHKKNPSLAGGDTVTFTSCPAGWQPILVDRVWSTGTTGGLTIIAGYTDH